MYNLLIPTLQSISNQTKPNLIGSQLKILVYTEHFLVIYELNFVHILYEKNMII